ncbi:hypothetical protein WDU94_006114, partial [Cyamophila willieti]
SALKDIGGKAGELLEKGKKDIEELAAEKKAAASSLIESQVNKTKESFSSALGNAETQATTAADEAKKAAIDSFDEEIKKAEGAVDSTVQQLGVTVDEKIKEVDHLVDEKRDEVTKQVTDAAQGALNNLGNSESGGGAMGVLGKAKGLLNCEYCLQFSFFGLNVSYYYLLFVGLVVSSNEVPLCLIQYLGLLHPAVFHTAGFT